MTATAMAGVTKEPYLIWTGDNTRMQVLWQLDVASTCAIEWGEDTTYSSGSAQTTEYGDDHQHTQVITGLTPGTRYYYRVTADAEVYTGSFVAAPPAEASAVKFLAYGDTRSSPLDHDAVAEPMVSSFLANEGFQSFVLMVGDLVNDGDLESDWSAQFFSSAFVNIRALLANSPYQSCIGNHEGTGVLFVKYFPYPYVGGRYWSFDYGPAHFVVVDQYTDYGPGSAQLDWITDDLASTDKAWRFIYLHEPGWSAGGHGNEWLVQTYIQPLCEAYGVAILFAGHNHYYARAEVNGVVHITTGGGGAPLYAPDPGYPHVIVAVEAHHYCRVAIEDEILSFKAITPEGATIDSFSVTNPTASIPSPALGDGPWFGFLGLRPNPASDRTQIDFFISKPAEIRLEVYDVRGCRVATLLDGSLREGVQTQIWESAGSPTGVYFCRLQVGEKTKTRKVLLVN